MSNKFNGDGVPLCETCGETIDPGGGCLCGIRGPTSKPPMVDRDVYRTEIDATDPPRAYTADEVRDRLLDHIRHMAAYWATLPKIDTVTGKPMTIHDRCEGVAFSILSMLDGVSLVLPAFDLTVRVHDEDPAYMAANGQNWFEPGTVISDMLHEHFYKQEGE